MADHDTRSDIRSLWYIVERIDRELARHVRQEWTRNPRSASPMLVRFAIPQECNRRAPFDLLHACGLGRSKCRSSCRQNLWQRWTFPAPTEQVAGKFALCHQHGQLYDPALISAADSGAGGSFPMPSRRIRIGHADLSASGFLGDVSFRGFRDALEQSWSGGAEVFRYGRRWRISKPTDIGDDYWAGHLGFVQRRAFTTLDWDEKTQEFHRGAASGGVVVPFVVGLRERLVSFQLTSHAVKVNTVTGNLRALLNTESIHRWQVTPRVSSDSYEAWRRSVDRITKVTMKMTYPNPEWGDRKTVKAMFGDLDAYVVEVTAWADKDGGLDLERDFGQEMLDHLRSRYGTGTFEGIDRKTGASSKYKGTLEGSTAPIISHTPVTPDMDGEMSPDELKAAQREHTHELESPGDEPIP